MKRTKTRVGKIAGLLLLIAIGISLLFGTFGCAQEITGLVETPASVATPEPAETPAPTPTPAPAPTAPSEPSTSVVEPPAPESTTEPVPASGLSYVIVDTGQEKCYDNSREITCPQPHKSCYGQDAQYQGVQLAYQDNGDGTVSDLNTGLMWQQDPGDKMTYDEAAAKPSSFKVWQPPNIIIAQTMMSTMSFALVWPTNFLNILLLK